MAKGQLKGSILLVIASIIWGAAFVAQSSAMDNVGPFTFLALRSVLGALILIPVILIIDKTKKHDAEHIKTVKDKKTLLKGGVICGVFLCAASLLQQFSLAISQSTDPGKAGFLTAMYILFVPIIGLLLGKKISLRIVLCIIVAVIGMYFLCVTSSFSILLGDIFAILCAVVFSLHILTVDKFSPLTDGVRLSCIQFAVCAVISGICMFVFESPNVQSIKAASTEILYAGLMSSGVAYTLQIVAQKNVHPTTGSMIMSMESVFALLAQILIASKYPSQREVIGCILMFGAVIISQIPSKRQNNM